MEQPLNGEEVVTVEGEPNPVVVGPKPRVLLMEDPHPFIRRGSIGGGMMGLLLASGYLSGEELGIPVITRDIPSERKKCLVCGKLSLKPFCCGDHARVWKEYKKAERRS